MKKVLMVAVAVSALGLAGCAVVPAYEAQVVYTPPIAVVAAPAVVVRPYFYGHYSYYRGPHGHRYYR